jgi:hypothetical protein
VPARKIPVEYQEWARLASELRAPVGAVLHELAAAVRRRDAPEMKRRAAELSKLADRMVVAAPVLPGDSMADRHWRSAAASFKVASDLLARFKTDAELDASSAAIREGGQEIQRAAAAFTDELEHWKIQNTS